MQVKRDLSTPLSRSKPPSNLVVALTVLGTLGLVAIAGFLFTMSFHAETVSMPQGQDSAPDHIEAMDPPKSETSLRINDSDKGIVREETLLLTTKHGTLRIVLRPDLSPDSADYIREMVETGTCTRCKLYRAEDKGILQGVMESKQANVKVTKGKCPPEYQDVKPDNCPEHDRNCGCHGPTMTRGMVGWAGGQTGPDFFIDWYPMPAKHWGQQHTVFGEVKDDTSFALIDKIFTLPVTKKGMTYLDEPLHFTIELE